MQGGLAMIQWMPGGQMGLGRPSMTKPFVRNVQARNHGRVETFLSRGGEVNGVSKSFIPPA